MNQSDITFLTSGDVIYLGRHSDELGLRCERDVLPHKGGFISSQHLLSCRSESLECDLKEGRRRAQ